MKLTLASLAESVRQELGREPGRSTIEALINEAGEAWANAHSWVHLRDRSQDVEMVAGVESYRLGLGVRNVTKVLRPQTVYSPIRLVDWDFLEAERVRGESAQAWAYSPIASLQWATEEGDDRPRLYLRIFPVTTTETLRVIYSAGWLPLDESGDVADVPQSLTVHFLDWVRLYANTREKPDQYPVGSLDAFKRTESFMAARRVDGSLHRRIIPAPGGAGARYARKRARGMGFPSRDDLSGLDPNVGIFDA